MEGKAPGDDLARMGEVVERIDDGDGGVCGELLHRLRKPAKNVTEEILCSRMESACGRAFTVALMGIDALREARRFLERYPS